MAKKKPKHTAKKPEVTRPPQTAIAQGEAIAKRMISETPGFGDLANFRVAHTAKEFRELGVHKDKRNWVGMYLTGSVDRGGAIVLVKPDAHVARDDFDDRPATKIANTLCHEMGHALWELLDDESRDWWRESQAGHRWGPEEAFADDFMYLVSGRRSDMNDEALFMSISGGETPVMNPDERLRDLGRAAAASGAPEDEARHMVELVRTGQVRPDHLEFLAQLGDRAAGIATGVAPVLLQPSGRVDYQQILTVREAGRWISRSNLGATFMAVLVFAAFEALRDEERLASEALRESERTPSWRAAQFRRVLEWISRDLATGGFARDWRAVASDARSQATSAEIAQYEHWRGTPVGLGTSVFEGPPSEHAEMTARLLDRLSFTDGLSENLLRRLKPYVIAGSPDHWDTEWSWGEAPGGPT